ncbi:porin family protein [Mongoliitalea daihaiensis]|uniref:porin family protein n=1 Tax=Mongoliitalea daihaiensis TaxID=2782006 RepID=UPI001F310BA9|nr:porin family protein [Mongoliitalea daihaiensis]UJP64717.1 PorT family protein [Mongoliitalea daihaiensis]
MKKILLILGVCMGCLVLESTAQTSGNDNRERITAGLKVGLNRSNVWDAQGQDFRADAKTGFAGGLFVGIPLGKYFGFQPELLLSRKGFKGNGTLLGTGYSFSRTSTFIDIPLQLQVKPIRFVTLLIGPQFSHLFKEHNSYTFGSNSTEQEEAFEKIEARKNVLGFVGGVDLNINRFVISGRFGYDLLNNHGDGSTTVPRYKNQWLQLTFGLKI